MESWYQRIFLKALRRLKLKARSRALLVACSLFSYAHVSIAEDITDYDEEEDNRTVLDAVISPDLKRRKIKEDKIDSENIEVGFFAGVMSIEDFGSNNVYGAKLAFHISEDFFLEAAYGSSDASESSAEFLGNFVLLTPAERELIYYNISFGVNIFPGEVYLGKNYAFNTSYYVIAGVGNTEFASDEYFTYNFGGGFRIFPTDWLSFHVDFRNHLFTHNIFSQDKSVQNLESSLGLSIYF